MKLAKILSVLAALGLASSIMAAEGPAKKGKKVSKKKKTEPTTETAPAAPTDGAPAAAPAEGAAPTHP